MEVGTVHDIMRHDIIGGVVYDDSDVSQGEGTGEEYGTIA